MSTVHQIGEFGFPIEGPEWEDACDEAERDLRDLVKTIKSRVPLPPPSPEIEALLNKVISERSLGA
jgi:hypothetical protein